MKVCNTCSVAKPDDALNFLPRLKRGGIWGTTAKCRECHNVRLKELREEKRLVREIEQMMRSAA